MRSVDACPYRILDPSSGEGEAACRLLREVTGLVEPGACRVRLDACSACCAEAEPSPDRLNPVVASLLSKLMDAVIAHGGKPGCRLEEASTLREWAHQHLRVEFPSGTKVSLPRRATERCYALGEPLPGAAPGDDNGPFFHCAHPDHRITTPDRCHLCRDWSDRPGPDPRPLAELVPTASGRSGPRVTRWSVGMTTAPRDEPTVDWSLDSLARAGWDAPRLFQDTPVTVARRWSHLSSTVRDGRVGAWPNYYLGLIELLMRDPEADAYMMVQDDVLFYDRQDLRAWLETILWPGETAGLVSLYGSSAYTRREAGWHAVATPWVWGALAFIFPRDLAKRFVADPLVLEHRWTGPRQGLAHIDVLIGRWAARHGLSIHYPSPSLTQHIGDVSTIWRTSQAIGPRRADRFLGDP